MPVSSSLDMRVSEDKGKTSGLMTVDTTGATASTWDSLDDATASSEFIILNLRLLEDPVDAEADDLDVGNMGTATVSLTDALLTEWLPGILK